MKTKIEEFIDSMDRHISNTVDGIEQASKEEDYISAATKQAFGNGLMVGKTIFEDIWQDDSLEVGADMGIAFQTSQDDAGVYSYKAFITKDFNEQGIPKNNALFGRGDFPELAVIDLMNKIINYREEHDEL